MPKKQMECFFTGSSESYLRVEWTCWFVDLSFFSGALCWLGVLIFFNLDSYAGKKASAEAVMYQYIGV